ncbi:hypothetical protein WME90_20850 [Sorangium sp. So ce375]
MFDIACAALVTAPSVAIIAIVTPITINDCGAAACQWTGADGPVACQAPG